MKKRNVSLLLATAAVALLTPALYARVKVATIFNSDMVLQREVPLPVWGSADPGEAITVTFAGETRKTKACAKGKWQVTFSPKKVNKKGQNMVIKGKNTITFKNILIGDVWLCSGQSNMEMSFNWKVIDGDKHIKEAARFPLIRQAKIAKRKSDFPTENVVMQHQWRGCDQKTMGGCTAAGYYFARRIHLESGIPIGILNNSWSGSSIRPYIAPEGYQGIAQCKNEWNSLQEFLPGTPAYKKQLLTNIENFKKWIPAAEAALKKNLSAPPMPPVRTLANIGNITSQYNIMLAPIVRFPVKGVIWYQGCSDAGRRMGYYYYMHALVNGWRKVMKNDFPFYFVQLAAYTGATHDPRGGNGYAVVREAQRKAMDIPKSGMACTIDIGMQRDIHPKNKYDVGERLALWALRDVYGKKDVVVSGPLFKSMKVDGNKAILTFDYAKGLMTAKKTGLAKPVKINAKPAHFAIAGADKVWYWADAVIEGEKVVLTSKNVKKPVAVRYAFRAYPDGVNMYNAAGLPMVPFRTDKW